MKTHCERREHPRLDDERLGALSGRVRPGHVVRVINLSAGGALIEIARRLAPGGVADLQLVSGELRHATRVRIVRSYVSRVLSDAMCFCCAVTFDRRLDWLSALLIEANAGNEVGAPVAAGGPVTRSQNVRVAVGEPVVGE